MASSPTRSSNSPLKEFSDSPIPDVIYFDTSFIVPTLIKGVKYHQPCNAFINRLTKSQPIIVMSQLVRSELWNAVLTIKMRDKFGKRRVDIDDELKKDPSLIDQVYPDIARIDQDFFDLMQRFVYWSMEDVTDLINKNAISLIKKYRLKSYDAIHIATMNALEVKDIAVFDWAIEDIQDLNIWTTGGATRYKKRQIVRNKVAKRTVV